MANRIHLANVQGIERLRDRDRLWATHNLPWHGPRTVPQPAIWPYPEGEMKLLAEVGVVLVVVAVLVAAVAYAMNSPGAEKPAPPEVHFLG